MLIIQLLQKEKEKKKKKKEEESNFLCIYLFYHVAIYTSTLFFNVFYYVYFYQVLKLIYLSSFLLKIH